MKPIIAIMLLSIMFLPQHCQADKKGLKKATQQTKPYKTGSQVYLYYKLPTGRNAYIFFNSDRTGRTYDEHRPTLEPVTYGNIPEEDAFIDALSKDASNVKDKDNVTFIKIKPETVPNLLKQQRPFELAIINGSRLAQFSRQHYKRFERHSEANRIPMTITNVTLYKNDQKRRAPKASLYAEKWMQHIAGSGRKLR